jgi:hypothetical protein
MRSKSEISKESSLSVDEQKTELNAIYQEIDKGIMIL